MSISSIASRAMTNPLVSVGSFQARLSTIVAIALAVIGLIVFLWTRFRAQPAPAETPQRLPASSAPPSASSSPAQAATPFTSSVSPVVVVAPPAPAAAAPVALPVSAPVSAIAPQPVSAPIPVEIAAPAPALIIVPPAPAAAVAPPVSNVVPIPAVVFSPAPTPVSAPKIASALDSQHKSNENKSVVDKKSAELPLSGIPTEQNKLDIAKLMYLLDESTISFSEINDLKSKLKKAVHPLQFLIVIMQNNKLWPHLINLKKSYDNKSWATPSSLTVWYNWAEETTKRLQEEEKERRLEHSLHIVTFGSVLTSTLEIEKLPLVKDLKDGEKLLNFIADRMKQLLTQQKAKK